MNRKPDEEHLSVCYAKKAARARASAPSLKGILTVSYLAVGEPSRRVYYTHIFGRRPTLKSRVLLYILYFVQNSARKYKNFKKRVNNGRSPDVFFFFKTRLLRNLYILYIKSDSDPQVNDPLFLQSWR